ncbi:restriction endonuclease subunit S [Pseudomonas rhodesiae]|uniref:restriction endonuclease subunit S n=1 Tax=Pseudomonas rhodesiae TaxID=76760 RepID=UPI0032B1D05C
MSFRAYPEYKPSGFDWLPEVPAHWVDRKIARDIPFVVGWTPPSGKDEYYDGDLPWVTIADMTQMSVEDTKSKISHLAVQDKGAKVVPAGSMLFSFKLSVGKIAFLTIDSYTNEAIAGFLPCGPLDLEYWKYAAPEFIPRYGRENIYGATLLNQELISSVRFSAPARAEQTQIARFLDHETARIDALIEEQQRLIELLKEKRQAVISHAVTKGLDPTVPMKDSGVEWLGEVPAHWEVLATKRFFRMVVDPAPDDNDFELLSVYTEIGVRPRKDLEQKGNKASTTDGYWRVKKGDLIVNKLLAWMGAVGYSDYDGVTSPAYDILRPSRQLSPKFYHYTFRGKPAQQEFKRWSRGIMEMRLRLYFDELGRISMPFPPPNEQENIVAYIEVMETKFDSLGQAASEQIRFLSERRSALISAAVTGKIDVRGWQPPASAPTPELVQEAV